MAKRIVEIAVTGLLISALAGCKPPPPKPFTPMANGKSVTLSKELDINEIAPDVFVVEHRFPWAANSLIVKVSGHEFVWVDTPYTRLATQEVMEWLERTYDQVSVVVINTGYHPDNLGGNEYLQRAGVTVFGSFLTDRLLRDKWDGTKAQILKWLTDKEHASFRHAYENMSLYPPNELFQVKEGLHLEFADDTVETYYPGPSHAEDNLVVYFKNKRILFGGCMVKELDAKNLGFTGDADLKKWPNAVEQVRDKYPDAHIVVPGHGAPGNLALLDHTLDLLSKW